MIWLEITIYNQFPYLRIALPNSVNCLCIYLFDSYAAKPVTTWNKCVCIVAFLQAIISF